MFRCVLTDPPWPEYGGGKVKRGAQRHYPLMKVPAIIDLHRELLYGADSRYRVADDAHLWIFVTNNYLPDGLEVMRALGFRYVTNVAWAKMRKERFFDSNGGAKELHLWHPQKPGLGQYLAGQHELLLFGVRGKLPALWKDKASGARRQGTLICAPRGKHSQKPEEAYEVIENVTPGPRLELFARGTARVGWDTWGNEARSETQGGGS